MKSFRFLSVALLVLVSGTVSFAADLNPYQTGDTAFDAALTEADALRAGDPGFLQQLALEFSVPVAELQALKDSGFKPGEIVLALDLAKSTKKPLREVTTLRKTAQGKGWGVIAQSLGVKPGSDAFKALKQNAVDETDRLKKDSEWRGGDTMMRAVEKNKDGGSMKKAEGGKKP